MALSLWHATPRLWYRARHPFSSDGSIDEPALRNLVAWQVESGIDFLVPCGTTGETPTLTHDEWLRVIDITIEVVAGRVPIVAGATSNSTHDAVAKAKEVAARPGVDAILTASPYYNKPTQEGQYRHFRAIAEAVDKPIILYNVPGRTGANIEPATLARLAEVPNIVGVKEASGNMTQIAEVMQRRAGNIFWSSPATTPLTLPVIALGGVGVISVASNEIPHEMAAMTRAALNNDWAHRAPSSPQVPAADAGQLHRVESAAGEGGLAMMGKIEEVYRLPLLPMRRDTRSKLQKIATEAGLVTKPAAAARPRRRFLHLRKLGRGPAQNRPAPLPLAASATTAKDAPPGMIPTTPAGTALTLRSPKPARHRSHDRRADSKRMQVHLNRSPNVDCRSNSDGHLSI